MRLFRRGDDLSRVHRNLNDHTPDGSAGWVVDGERVAEVVLRVSAVKVSAATLARIRTPRGERTPSGAQGLGRRTVGAWLVGEIVASIGDFTPTGATIHFNPFKDDAFQVRVGDDFADFIPCGQVVRFNRGGSVEVMG